MTDTDKKQLFGTNGVRGIVGELMTPEFVMKVGLALGSIRPGTIAVGRDTRTSGPAFVSAVKAGLMAVGCDVVDCGVLPTPALQYLVKTNPSYHAGVVITASHNPREYNGVKAIDTDGTEMADAESILIEQRIFTDTYHTATWENIGTERFDPNVVFTYVDSIVSQFPKDLGKGMTVVIDAGCGAAHATTAAILGGLGCRVITLNAHPDGYFPARAPEPSTEGLKPLSDLVLEVKADFGVAHDGDADRCVFVDDKGRFIEENREFALIEDAVCQRDGKSGVIVTPVSSSRIFETIAEKYSSTVEYTMVGSIYVARRMLELIESGTHVIFGGEGNGGLIYPWHQFCRDGGMTAAMMVSLLAQKKQPLFTLVDSLPPSYMLTYKYKTDKAPEILAALRAAFANELLNDIDGLRIDRDDCWALVRPSGTEPIVRLYVESPSLEIAEQFSAEVKAVFESLI
ncbi:MAG: phosphoglucosamine mutase [Methanomicrobiales archaeon]|jgi:phosphomannomutase/phosphoglucomutase|nr:phosphoglucosamine mutase [Methanomicrobiales archaeon]